MHVVPDIKRLEKKYKDELVVIGVHSAKFSSEKETENIREAIQKLDLEHPVINDRDFLVWNAFGVQAWPTLALIDPEGRYLGQRSGEGIYDTFDKVIGNVVREFEGKGKLNRKPMKWVLEKERKPKSALSYPGKIAADTKGGRIFFTDSNHHRVIVASAAGAIQQVIGEGSPGLQDGAFETAKFFKPQGICYDAARNALYVADTDNHAIRKIDLAAGRVTTLAGNGKQAEFPPTGGVGRSVALSTPWDVTLAAPDTLYIAMAGTHQLWRLNLKTLRCAPWAGSARENIVDGPAISAQLAQPSGLTTDGRIVYFADSEVSAIRSADTAANRVSTIIGTGLFDFGDVDGRFPDARLQHPLGVALRNGQVWVADTYNHKIKRVDPKTRSVVTVAGTGRRGMNDGPAKSATFSEPSGLAWLGDKLYVADTNNHLIRVFDPASGRVRTLKLTGLERLAKKATGAGFTGQERTLPVQEIAAEAKSLELVIQLPPGMKFNKDAPFRIKAASNKPESVAVGAFNITNPAASLSIPITARAGEAVVTVEMTINYCNAGNEGLCYFRDVRLIIPLKVTPAGAARPTATYAL